MFDNPFKPQEVKMFNYHPEHIEKNKINNITNNISKASQTRYEHKEKSFKDAVKLPPSYGDVLPKKDSYSNHLPQRQSYSDAMKRDNNGYKGN